VVSGGETVWEARSTMLNRAHPPGGSDSAPTPRTPEVDVPATATWKVPGDTGRRYATVSGDRNPIHLYGWTAKPFGFPRAIAHGLWTKARAVAALDGRLPDAFTVAVQFRKPVLLPTTVTFGSTTDAASGVTSFAVKDARKGSAHLVGTVTPASQPKPKAKPKPRAKPKSTVAAKPAAATAPAKKPAARKTPAKKNSTSGGTTA
jgi:acyl dehydratase